MFKGFYEELISIPYSSGLNHPAPPRQTGGVRHFNPLFLRSKREGHAAFMTGPSPISIPYSSGLNDEAARELGVDMPEFQSLIPQV